MLAAIHKERENNKASQLPVPVLKAFNLLYENFLIHPTSPLNTSKVPHKVKHMRTCGEKLLVGVDMSFILDHTKILVDYAFISKHFHRAWDIKYKV